MVVICVLLIIILILLIILLVLVLIIVVILVMIVLIIIVVSWLHILAGGNWVGVNVDDALEEVWHLNLSLLHWGGDWGYIS